MARIQTMLKGNGVIMNLSMDEKIQIKNLCNWTVSFKRIDSVGDVLIPANTTMRIARGEVFSQVQSGNVLFTGTDSMGSHARIYINDKDTRVELDFESEDGKRIQNVISDEKIKEIFAIKTKAAFEKSIKENIVTQAEMAVIANGVKKFKLNEYDKVKFIEEYTGMKIN